MIAALDVEFLLEPRSEHRVLVYRMRTGILRHRVMDALRALYKEQGLELHQCEAKEIEIVGSGASLIPGAYFCDLSSEAGVGIAALTSTITSASTSNVAIFANYGSRLFTDRSWFEADGILVLEEPLVVTDEIPEAIWDFLKVSCDLAPRHAFTTEGLKALFEAHLAGVKMALPELIHAFDSYVALHVNLASGHLLEDSELETVDRERSLLARPLAAYVRDPLMSHQIDVTRAIDLRLRNGWSKNLLVDELHRLSAKHLNGTIDGQYDFALWAALVVAWTARLRLVALEEAAESVSPDQFICTIDQMLRDYHVRSELPDRDKLAGLWEDLSRDDEVVQEGDGIEPELSLRDALADHLGKDEPYEPLWTIRLRAILNERRSAPMLSADEGRGDSKPRKLAHSLDDIIGHRVAVNAIKKRLCIGKHAPIYLFGPDGVGKETLALAYARAFLCEDNAQHPFLPCCKCGACDSFDTGTFSLVEIDGASHGADPTAVREWLKRIRFRAFAQRCAIVIKNPERAGRMIDTLLKTIEEKDIETLFILCGRDMDALSATGVSRCEVHRLSRLGYGDATRLSLHFCQLQKMVDLDAGVIELAVEKGAGLPKALARAVASIADGSAFNATDAAKALDFDWVPDGIADWISLLRPIDPSNSGHLSLLREAGPVLALERMRAVLSNLADRNLERALPPSWRPHTAALQQLVHLLAMGATATCRRYADLWSELAEYWGRDHGDLIGLQHAQRETRLILASTRQPSELTSSLELS